MTDVLSEIEKIEGFSVVKIIKAKIDNLSINTNSAASVEVSSSTNALNEAEVFLGYSNFKVDRLALVSDRAGEFFKWEISSTGMLSFPTDHYELVEKILVKAASSSN